MNSIVLWVGGIGALAIGVIFLNVPIVCAGYVLLIIAASLSLPGHNDD